MRATSAWKKGETAKCLETLLSTGILEDRGKWTGKHFSVPVSRLQSSTTGPCSYPHLESHCNGTRYTSLWPRISEERAVLRMPIFILREFSLFWGPSWLSYHPFKCWVVEKQNGTIPYQRILQPTEVIPYVGNYSEAFGASLGRCLGNDSMWDPEEYNTWNQKTSFLRPALPDVSVSSPPGL